MKRVWKGDKHNRVERKLKRLALKIEKLSRKEGLTYTSVYLIQSDEKLCSLNVRAMQEDFETGCKNIVCDSFAFIEGTVK